MDRPARPAAPGRPSRRHVLGVAALGLVGGATAATGCRGGGAPRQAPPADALEPLIADALRLAATHVATLSRHPSLAGRLTPLLTAHQAHAEAMLARVDPRRRSEITGDGGTAPVSPSVSPPAGATIPAALADLRSAERAGAVRARAACLAADGDRAALLGSVAAARASHEVALR